MTQTATEYLAIAAKAARSLSRNTVDVPIGTIEEAVIEHEQLVDALADARQQIEKMAARLAERGI